MQSPHDIGSTPEPRNEPNPVSPVDPSTSSVPAGMPASVPAPAAVTEANWRSALDSSPASPTAAPVSSEAATAEGAPVEAAYPPPGPLPVPAAPLAMPGAVPPAQSVTAVYAAPTVSAPEPVRTETVRVASMNPLAAMLGGGVLACLCVALGAFLGSRGSSPADPVSYGNVSPQSGNAIVNAVRNVGPSVMNVDTEFGRTGGTSEFLPNPGSGSQPQRGKGTGVVIDSKQGLMLTNAHVVADAKRIQVTTRDGETYSGQLIGSDRLSDIAVVKLSNRTLPQARLAPIKDPDHDLAIGEWAIAIGNPFAQANTVTVGVVSAVGRTIPVPGGRDGQGFQLTDMIQTDAAINPGNSGGPLCNIKGEVIGINTAIIPFGTGLGFTIPINKAMNVADQLIKKGKVQHPFVGIQMLPVTDDVKKGFGLPDKKGTLVSAVEAGSPAAKAGIRQGDVIRAINGQPVDDSEQVQKIVALKKVGDSMEVQILRNNSVKKTLKIVIGDRPQ